MTCLCVAHVSVRVGDVFVCVCMTCVSLCNDDDVFWYLCESQCSLNKDYKFKKYLSIFCVQPCLIMKRVVRPLLEKDTETADL